MRVSRKITSRETGSVADERQKYRTGMVSAFCCMTIWGVMPIYWDALAPISPFVVVLYRIVLSGIASFVLALKTYGIKGIAAPLKQKKTALKMFVAGLLVALNWSINVYAVHSGQVIETSIGFYMDPLLICVFGIVFFKERPAKYKAIAIAAACLGVLVILVNHARLPLIALSIALTFSTYAAIKKHLRLPAAVSLFCESLFLIPPATISIIYFELNGNGAFSTGQPHQLVLLFLIGIITATPLFLFAIAANRISLVSLGIIEYIGPSLILLLGIFLFKEPFDMVWCGAFAAIWVGLVIFTFGEIKNYGKAC